MKKEKKGKILIVEDEVIISENIKNTLTKKNYEVIGTPVSGAEAIEFVKKYHPDLILMDIMLKGDMDGIKVAESITAEFDIPIIYLTAFADDTTLKRARITEPYGYILKPFEERELYSNIEIAMYKHEIESRLKESEAKYRILTENAASGIFIVQEDKIQYANPSTESLTGYTRQELIGKDFWDIVQDDFIDVVRDRFKSIIENKQTDHRFGFKIITKNSKNLWIDFNSTFIEYESKPAILGEANNITDRKNAEDKILLGLKKVQQTLHGMTEAITLIVEARDPYTAGHQRRVSNLATAIATEMKLSQDMTEGIRIAGAIHDLGKISVPSEILSKPGKISDIEFQIIKNHPQIAYEILKNIDFTWPIAEVVYQHHERIDGSGYPRNLKDKDILLEAKILMVADVIEAMMSHRPYRAALGIDIALGEISGKKGIIYDESVVDACLKVFNEKNFVF
jgi:PAS domain S-box-containing protein